MNAPRAPKSAAPTKSRAPIKEGSGKSPTALPAPPLWVGIGDDVEAAVGLELVLWGLAEEVGESEEVGRALVVCGAAERDARNDEACACAAGQHSM